MKVSPQQRAAPKHLPPWLVRASDFRRYPGRALDYCLRGGVVFFYYTWKTGSRKGRSQLFALKSIELTSEMYWQIFADLCAGRFRAVDLSKLPIRRRRKKSNS